MSLPSNLTLLPQKFKVLIDELNRALNMIESSTVNAWDLIESIIYEWHESAIAISSPELLTAFNDETDEVPLTPPSVDNEK